MGRATTNRLEAFETLHAALKRALADPLATSGTVALAAARLDDHAAKCRSLLAGDSAERLAVRAAIEEISTLANAKVKPRLAAYFADQNVFLRNDLKPVDTPWTVPVAEVVAFLKALVAWERRLGAGAELNAFMARVCDEALALSVRCVKEFKQLQSPDDFPDYRTAAHNLLKLDSVALLLVELDRLKQAEEVRRLSHHHGKIALLSALDVIDRHVASKDIYAHFDIAAMLVSFEDIVMVITQVSALVDQERGENPHPYVETLSEHVLLRFEKGLFQLTRSYLQSFDKAMSDDAGQAPSIILSIVRILVQIARIATLLQHLTGSKSLAGVVRKISTALNAGAERAMGLLARSPDRQKRLREIYAALEALG
ncbi:MAG: hypothetical protein HQ481_08225 [Alphaproteobacteria bacterium]|nr:hypothetical protein [Alphaproteobacteria bacterium]